MEYPAEDVITFGWWLLRAFWKCGWLDEKNVFVERIIVFIWLLRKSPKDVLGDEENFYLKLWIKGTTFGTWAFFDVLFSFVWCVALSLRAFLASRFFLELLLKRNFISRTCANETLLKSAGSLGKSLLQKFKSLFRNVKKDYLNWKKFWKWNWKVVELFLEQVGFLNVYKIAVWCKKYCNFALSSSPLI